MEIVAKATDFVQNFREKRLSGLKPASEFFDHRQLSRPTNINEATQRITYNTRHFSANYLLVIIILVIYALVTNPFLLIAIAWFAGGFTAITKFGPEPLEFGSVVITQKIMYIALLVVGLPILFVAGPAGVFFWLIGSSAILILGHASLMETSLENDYQGVETV